MSIRSIGKMKQKIQLRSKAKALEPILRIGKNGLTENVVTEINELLKNKNNCF